MTFQRCKELLIAVVAYDTQTSLTYSFQQNINRNAEKFSFLKTTNSPTNPIPLP